MTPDHGPGVETLVADIAEPSVSEGLLSRLPDVIFDLAAVVSGEAEADFEKGYRVNLDATRRLFDAARSLGRSYRPRVVFSSSIAVYGPPFPDVIGDEHATTPATSYGTQKAIAERLGTTKAALYYHFERKQDILLELHLRLHALGREALEQLESLEDGQARADAWPGLVDHFIDQVVDNRELVQLHQRNHSALEELLNNERHRAENDDIEQQFRRVLESPTIPLAQRVRMVCSLGAVVSALVGAEGLFGDVPIPELAQLVREAVRDLLGAQDQATRPPAPATGARRGAR